MTNAGRPIETVNHPAHYNTGSIEVIAAIEDWKLGFHAGNVVKYVVRAPHKNGLEDLKKARWYLDRLIANAEREKEDHDRIQRRRDRGQHSSLWQTPHDDHRDLPAIHPLGSDDAPGSGAECSQQPGDPVAQDDGRDSGIPSDPDSLGVGTTGDADGGRDRAEGGSLRDLAGSP